MGSNPTLSATPADLHVHGIAVRIRRKPMRNLRLVVESADGPVRVSVPLRTRDDAVRTFVSDNLAWILRQQVRLAGRPAPTPANPEEERRNREQLQLIVPSLLDRWQPVIGVTITGFRVRRMKTRWGSCNTRARRISLSTELAQRSPACLEYVLVHELVHLLERGHNARFYGYLDRFLPDWRERRALLNIRPVPAAAHA